MKKERPKKRSLISLIFRILIFVAVIAGIGVAYLGYKVLYSPNVKLNGKESIRLYIPTGSEYRDVVDMLYEKDVIDNTTTFEWIAEKKNYRNHVRPGRYHLTEGMGNNELIDLLRSGQQKPVRLTFNNIRTKEQLAGRISTQLELDSLSLITRLNDAGFMSSYNFTPKNSKLMFLPNTYEVYWNISVESLFDRIYSEYKRFWNDERKQKAKSINFTPDEAGILASIIQLETNKTDEMARIAGVYINRLQRNMALQADPTVIFAVGDFTIKRVLNKYLEIDSPYNTYKYRGLPPGPISLPEISAIDSVLDYEEHDYLFFSAKEDFSGYHNFAKTRSEHVANAIKYRHALDERGIMK